ncbi:MAG: PHP domain-containing protein [Anaerolineae bacterium]
MNREPGLEETLRPLWADLHVHTVVSPCAEVEMIPPLIVQRACALGLGLIAVTDHNTAENVAAVQEAGARVGLAVLPGMEVQTREEAHILCLFDRLDQVLDWQEHIYAQLPALKNRDDVFGAQFVVDAEGEFVRLNERLLLTSTSLSVEQVVDRVRGRGGLAIAAHVDRPSFSLLANLGFIPPALPLAACEISRWTRPQEAVERVPGLRGWPLIASGDAHRLSDMRASSLFTVHETTVRELEWALRGERGRRIKLFA